MNSLLRCSSLQLSLTHRAFSTAPSTCSQLVDNILYPPSPSTFATSDLCHSFISKYDDLDDVEKVGVHSHIASHQHTAAASKEMVDTIIGVPIGECRARMILLDEDVAKIRGLCKPDYERFFERWEGEPAFLTIWMALTTVFVISHHYFLMLALNSEL